MGNNLIAFFSSSAGHLLTTLMVFGCLYLVNRVVAPKLEQSADDGNFKPEAANQAKTLIRFISGSVALLLVFLIWGIKFSSILVFSTTMLTLLGVALFAQWSIISNVTAYFILLTHPNIKRGYFIRVMDFDNYVEGYVSELNLFSTKLITEDREIVIYPNNQLLGRPMMVNPRSRWNSIGKLAATPIADDT